MGEIVMGDISSSELVNGDTLKGEIVMGDISMSESVMGETMSDVALAEAAVTALEGVEAPAEVEDLIEDEVDDAEEIEAADDVLVPQPILARPIESGRAVLVLTTAEQPPQVVDFGTRSCLTVGRTEPADVCAVDPGVSRLHVRFSREPGGLRVIDLGSHNGTWVRGLRVTEALLASGDSVVIGNTSVLIQITVPGAATAREGQPVVTDISLDEAHGRLGQGVNLRESLREHEAKLIREALRSSHGNQRRAAALLELPLRTFERKLRNMNLRQQAIARAAM